MLGKLVGGQRLVIGAVVGLLLFSTLSGCRRSSAEGALEVLGRWQRISEPAIGEPELLLSEYLEFRAGGQVAVLLHDAGPDQFWTIRLARYEFPARNQIELSDSCWKRWERFDCTRVYAFTLAGDSLRIADGAEADQQVAFRRVGAPGEALPPTLAPPYPSPIP